MIKGAVDSDGNPVAVPRRAPRQIVSAQTSAEVRDLMQAASTDRQHPLQTQRYPYRGKTGTAQLANAKCDCYKGYVTSYVGSPRSTIRSCSPMSS